MIRLSDSTLIEFASAILVAAGVADESARNIAESLVAANLRGHDSHGLIRIPEYLGQLKSGELVADAPLTIERETANSLIADGQFGFGQLQMRRLIEQVIPLARQQGFVCAVMRRSGHIGRLGEWVESLANKQLAGLISVNDNGVLKCVAPPGGIEPRLSTNPIAIGVPTSDEPIILDMSTSAVANGKIQVARTAGVECPPGWLQDADGRPTTDPHTRFQDPPGSLLPMGGPQGYKGFGLALMLDFLVSGLTGGYCPPAPDGERMTNNVLLLAWNPDHFAGREHFVSEVEKLAAYVRDTTRQNPSEPIRLPGDGSRRHLAERRREGVPLDEGTWQTLCQVADRLNVSIPE